MLEMNDRGLGSGFDVLVGCLLASWNIEEYGYVDDDICGGSCLRVRRILEGSKHPDVIMF